jgi:phage baseplate assembly protein W
MEERQLMLDKVTSTTISLPFTISSYGTVTSTNSLQKIWQDKVRSAIGTTFGERVMRPQLGTTIPLKQMGTRSVMEQDIRTEISRAFTSYLPSLTLDNILISFDEYQNIITAEILYTIPTSRSTPSKQMILNIGIATISGNSQLTEEFF